MRYRDILKDARWLRKRKGILRRDGYKCTVCGAKSNLVVHHTFYYKGSPPPWQYPNSSLLTLCEKCHRKYHETHELTIKPPKKRKKKRPVGGGIPYPNKKMSLAAKVEFKKNWLKKKKDPLSFYRK